MSNKAKQLNISDVEEVIWENLNDVVDHIDTSESQGLLISFDDDTEATLSPTGKLSGNGKGLNLLANLLESHFAVYQDKVKAKPTTDQMVEFVKTFAIKNYNRFGWDVVVEAMTDEELAQVIEASRVRTLDGAATCVYKHVVKPHAEGKLESKQ